MTEGASLVVWRSVAATMGGGVLSGRAMARLWACVALLAVAWVAGENDPELLRLGERALCRASHSRFAHLQPRTPSKAFPRLTATCKPAGYNVFLVFGVRPCSGVLLSESHVITSMYCAENADNGTAFLGGLRYQTLQDLQLPEVKIAIVIEFFNFNHTAFHLDHDIRIGRLNKRFEQDNRINYAVLTTLTKWEEPAGAIFMGFGETFEGDTVHELRSGHVMLECGQMCSQEISTYKLDENALCGNSSYTMCWGDMGGAVVDAESGALVGLVSYKTMKKPTFRMCTEPAIRTFFMFIGYYRDWILSVINPKAFDD